jgi:hypothetical protein
MKNVYEIGKEILNFLLYPKFEGWLLIIKIIFLGFGTFFLGFIIWALFNTAWLKRLILWDLKEFLTYCPYVYVKKHKKEWRKIKERLEVGLESESKLALIEADNLLNQILIEEGYLGENLDERLEKLTIDILPNLEKVKEIHKIVNNIVHDPSYKLDLEEAKKIISIYEEALIELDVL